MATAKEVIEQISDIETVDQVKDHVKGDERKTVIEAANARIGELDPEAELIEMIDSGSKSKIKVRITAPVAGKFLLPYTIDQEVSLESKQATDLMELGYAVKA